MRVHSCEIIKNKRFSSWLNFCVSTTSGATYQNLNSGKRLMNGLNSSLAFVGREGPSSGKKEKNKHENNIHWKVQVQGKNWYEK